MWLDGRGRRRAQEKGERDTNPSDFERESEQESNAICIYSRILSFQDKLIKSRDDDDDGNAQRAGSERETFANTT